MLGISYGELFLLLGATAALIGPKDLPRIARAAGRLSGRAIGYVQLGRGQLEIVLQQSQASQVHKELQDTMAQLEAIRHEIRSISIINPGPLTRRMDNQEPTSASSGPSGNSVTQRLDEVNGTTNTVSNGNSVSQRLDEVSGTTNTVSKGNSVPQRFNEVHGSTNSISKGNISDNSLPRRLDEVHVLTNTIPKEGGLATSNASNLQSQAAAYARLAEASTLKSSGDVEKLKEEGGLLAVLPVSAESAGLLPNRRGEATGSDLMLEAILEADVAQNAKHFFAQNQNQIPSEERCSPPSFSCNHADSLVGSDFV